MREGVRRVEMLGWDLESSAKGFSIFYPYIGTARMATEQMAIIPLVESVGFSVYNGSETP
jgi:hypothetical protein